MDVVETFYRPGELRRTASSLPADIYNLAHTLLARAGSGSLFVPIRSMQYLAVLDAEECIFVDGNYRPFIDVAWQSFRPQARAALDEPVTYEVVVYHERAEAQLRRLQGEFAGALRTLAARRQAVQPVVAKIIPLDRSGR